MRPHPLALAAVLFVAPQSQSVDLPNKAVLSTDTMDTYTQRNGVLTKSKNYYVRIVAGSPAVGFALIQSWYDSAGKWTTTQTTRTQPGRFVVASQEVKALTDSANVTFQHGRAKGWVQPSGKPRVEVDGPAGDRIPSDFAAASIATIKGMIIGDSRVINMFDLYGANPLATRPDTFEVNAFDTLMVSGKKTAVWKIEVNSGRNTWWWEMDTGRLVMRRGQISPGFFWVHARRGVEVSFTP